MRCLLSESNGSKVVYAVFYSKMESLTSSIDDTNRTSLSVKNSNV